MNIRDIEKVMNLISDAVLVMDQDNTIQFINETAKTLLSGLPNNIQGKSFDSVIHLENQSGTESAFPQTTQRRSASLVWNQTRRISVEYTLNSLETGRIFIFQKESMPRTSMEKPSQITGRNIPENIHDGMVYIEPSGIIRQVDTRMAGLFGRKRSDMIHRAIQALTVPVDESGETLHIQVARALKRKNSDLQLGIKSKTGQIRILHCKSMRIMHAGKVEGLLIILENKDPFRDGDNKLSAVLEERDLMLQEIHHRVNNNLQIISSLLHLQSFHFTDKKVLDFIKESQNRIKTMAILHEMLHQSRDFTHIDFEAYVRVLIRHLMSQFRSISDRVPVHLEIEKIAIDLENTVYFGLIINELTSNALKYGFPNGATGKITIILKRSNPDTVELIVRNNGEKIPDEMDIKTAQSLGIRLVRLLSEKQMRGSLSLERLPETTFTIVLDEKLLNP